MAVLISKRTKQELDDWWIDGLVKRNLPMIENRREDNSLTPACERAKERGARLVPLESLRNRSEVRYGS